MLVAKCLLVEVLVVVQLFMFQLVSQSVSRPLSLAGSINISWFIARAPYDFVLLLLPKSQAISSFFVYPPISKMWFVSWKSKANNFQQHSINKGEKSEREKKEPRRFKNWKRNLSFNSTFIRSNWLIFAFTMYICFESGLCANQLTETHIHHSLIFYFLFRFSFMAQVIVSQMIKPPHRMT